MERNFKRLMMRGGTAAVAAFSPSTLSPLAWYDPSDLTTLFQDTTAATPVTADGQSVALMRDKSGNGHHLEQPTASKRPLYKTSGGLSWLLLDGTDDEIGQVSNAATLTATHEITVAANWTLGLNVTGGLLSYVNTSDLSAEAELAIYGSATARIRSRYPGQDTFSTGSVVLQSTDQVYSHSKVASNDLRQYIDGAAGLTFSTVTTAFTTPRSYRIGRHTNAAQYLGGRWYGGIVTAVLTTTERANLTTWIGAKQGRTL